MSSFLMGLDWSVVVGITGGIIGGCSYFRMARLNVLKVEIESLRRQFNDLDGKFKVVELERDAARREIVSHYTARTEISAENQRLHQKLEQRDEQLLRAKEQIVELQNSQLSTALRALT